MTPAGMFIKQNMFIKQMKTRTRSPRKRAAKTRITKPVSLASELATWAESEAQKENRTLSNYVETVLRQRMEAAVPA